MGEATDEAAGGDALAARRLAQLGYAHETARAIHGQAVQILMIGGTVKMALLTFALERHNGLLVTCAGAVLLVVVYQLLLAGRAFAGVVASACILERDLGLDAGRSLVYVLFGGLEGSARQDRLRGLAQAGASGDRAWLEQVWELSPWRRGPTTMLFLAVGVAEVLAGPLLVYAGWI